ncbi:hypothetical protein BD414DRAFT_229546 [Trametes punicea]|nr:hypothetical protein BD414DRAFT_229546 [Trametes punicea]
MSTFFPMPGTYVLAQLDVKATLATLNDPIAEAQGASLQAAKCIIYLHTIFDLPFPDNAHFKYGAYIVGPGLRPAVPERCITSDMCVPIFPNVYHPSGSRAPVRPSPDFPFANCYHWNGTDMHVEVRAINEERDYEPEEGIKLPVAQYLAMEEVRVADIWESLCDLRKVASSLAADLGLPKPGPESLSHSLVPSENDGSFAECLLSPQDQGSTGHSSLTDLAEDDDSDENASESDGGSYYDPEAEELFMMPSSAEGESRDEVISDMDIFGPNYNPRDDVMPIVQVRLDLSSRCTEETIPDPMKFLKLRSELIKYGFSGAYPGVTTLIPSPRIIQESRGRTRARVMAEMASQDPTYATHCDDAPEHGAESAGEKSKSEAFKSHTGVRLGAALHCLWLKVSNAALSALCLHRPISNTLH